MDNIIIEKYYSKALAKGKDVREIADYGVIAEITEEEAESVIEDAGKFLERIKEAIRAIEVEKWKYVILQMQDVLTRKDGSNTLQKSMR